MAFEIVSGDDTGVTPVTPESQPSFSFCPGGLYTSTRILSSFLEVTGVTGVT